MIHRRSLPTLIAATAAFVLAGCSADPLADDVNPEDLRVLRAMVDISCKLDGERVVISDRPATPPAGERSASEERNVQFGIDLNQRLAHHARWPRGQICAVVHIESETAIATALENETGFPGSWENFTAKFGGARTLTNISLPVYSPDRKRAILYTASSCPFSCGAGFYHELEKTYEGWRIKSSTVAWTL